MNQVRVLIVDDHPFFREGLRNVLSAVPDLEVIGEAEDGAGALKAAFSLHPDVIIMDINIPTLNGLEATRHIKNAEPDIKVIMLTAYDDDEQIYHAIRTGASAYYPKDVSPEHLVEVIRHVNEGKYVIGKRPMNEAEMEEWMVAAFEQYGNVLVDMEEKFMPLSPREMEILRLVTQGLSNKEVAFTLGISHQTVKNHMTSILRKLDVEDRTQAAVQALRRGWVRLEDTTSE